MKERHDILPIYLLKSNNFIRAERSGNFSYSNINCVHMHVINDCIAMIKPLINRIHDI